MGRERTRSGRWPVLAVVFLAVYATDVLASQPQPRLARDAARRRLRDLGAVRGRVRRSGSSLATDRGRYCVASPARRRRCSSLPFLRPLRVLRLVIAAAGAEPLGRRLAARQGRGVRQSTSAVLLVFCGALAVLDAERGHAGREHRDLRRRAVVGGGHDLHRRATATGSRSPTEGRFVGVGLMVGGVALVGAVTASFATWLIDRVRVRGGGRAGRDRGATCARCTPSCDGIERELAELEGRCYATRSGRRRTPGDGQTRRRRRRPRPGSAGTASASPSRADAPRRSCRVLGASAWTNRSPRISEAPAAISSMTIAALNAISSPCRNGSEIRCGKKSCP